jgi:hypothetical protein
MGRAAWAAVLGLAMAAQAGAQPRPAAPADPEANVVEALVITARRPAPAWWRVKKGGSEVWILGVLDTPLPPDVSWRREALDEHLKGANGLIEGARLHLGLEDLFGLIRLYSLLRGKTPMEEGLDPDLRARFVAERVALGKGPERYSAWRPMIAGSMLLRDARPAGSADVGRQVRAEAGRLGVAARPAGEYDFIPFARTALGSMTPPLEAQCLAAALDDAEAGPAAMRRAAVGWARGDVETALTAPRRFDRCLLLMAGGPDLWRRSTDDMADAIVHALETPGHSVAIIPLRRLLAKDGLVESLKVRGLKVEADAVEDP